MLYDYPLISKEQIPDMTFAGQEVLLSPQKIKDRANKLQKAAEHGKFFYKKTTIVFETSDGIKTVFANIWETTDHHIVFTGGITIPVRCIHEVSFT
jgi:hypothetical protein